VPAPLRNQFAVGFGRPIEPAKAITRIEDNAAKLARYRNQVIGALLLGQEPPPLPPDIDLEVGRFDTSLRHLNAVTENLREAIARLEAAPSPRPRRKRAPVKIHGDDFVEAVATAAAALDRLVSEETSN
jgi:hypothetical protein